MEIRPAATSEAVKACEVLRRCISQCCVEDHRNDPEILARWLVNKTPEIVADWFAWPSHYSLVATDNDAVLGVGMLSRPGKMVLLHVDPDWRFRGVGKALLHALEMRASRFGATALRVASTVSAKPFYERHGYQVVGTTAAIYGQALKMVKSLPRGKYKSAKQCRCTPF